MKDECTAELQTESLQGAMGCTSDGLKELARRFPQTYDSNMTNEMQRLHGCASGFTIYPMEQKIGKYKALATATRNSNCPDLNLTCDKPFHVFPNACSGAVLLEQNPRVFYVAFFAFSSVDNDQVKRHLQTRIALGDVTECQGKYKVTGNCFGLNAVNNEDLPPVTPPDPPKVTDLPLKKSFEFGSRWGGQECDARLEKMKGPHSCTSEVVDQMPPEGKALMEAFHKCSGAFRIYPMDQGSKKAFAEPNVTRTFAGSYQVECHYPVDLTCNTSFGEFPNSCSGTLVLTPSRNGVVHPQVPFYMAFYAYSNFKTLNGHAEKIDSAWSHAAFETQVVASKSVICRGRYKLESGKCFGLTENQVNTALYPGPAMSPPKPPEIPSMLYPFPEVEAHFPDDDAGPTKPSRAAGYGWWIFIVFVMIIMVLGAFFLRRRRKIRQEESLQLQSNQF